MILGVYGLGRFGSFWASFLSKYSKVLVSSRSAHAAPEGTELVSLKEFSKADAIFICSSISSIPEVAENLAAVLEPGQVVLDTCSVKVWPLTQLAQILPPSISLLGTHPMFGPDSARNGTNGLPLVLCPAPGGRSSETLELRWREFFLQTGLNVLPMTADEHDREAAETQGITHLIGRILALLKLKPSSMATLGYKKLLDIIEQTCNDPWQLFVDLQEKNTYSVQIRQELLKAVEEINATLAQESKNERRL